MDHVLSLSARAPRTILRRPLALCGLAAPISFALGVVLAARQYQGYSHLTQAISELGAVDAPFPFAQTLNFLTAGALTVAFAIGLTREAALRRGAALFGLLGVVMVAHGLLPCDAACGFVTWVGTAHNVSGAFGFGAAIAGVWLCVRNSPRGAYRAYSAATAALTSLGFALWIALAKAAEIALFNGSLQRFFVAALLGWMFVTALRQLTTEAS